MGYRGYAESCGRGKSSLRVRSENLLGFNHPPVNAVANTHGVYANGVRRFQPGVSEYAIPYITLKELTKFSSKSVDTFPDSPNRLGVLNS